MPANGSWPTTKTNLLFQIQELEDRGAWRSFVDIYGTLVYEFCRRRGLQDADAADVTQEVFQKVARGIRGFEYSKERGKFRGWLGKITRHEIGRFLAKQVTPDGSQAESNSLDTLSQDFESEWNDQINARIMQSALERAKLDFDSRTWRAFEATWLENISNQDTARELQQSVAWIYKAKHKVLRRLKSVVNEMISDRFEC